MPRTMVAPAPINPSTLYSLEDIMQRLGCGAATIRLARKRGLTIRRVGRRSFVHGRDVIDYVLNNCAYVGADGKTRLPK